MTGARALMRGWSRRVWAAFGSKTDHRIGSRVVIIAAFLGGMLPQAVLAGTMTLPGQVAVSPSGAATYNIPIALPPGTAGVMPTLALDYNSQRGNGLLGVGWALAGLPSISRCPRTMAQDGASGGVNYDANDRFCMDGQRLVAYGSDGTEYRTEIDTLSKIISHGTAGSGPAWFEVHTKAGQILEFGNTTDSRILAQGKASAQVWAVNKVSDTKHNYFAVTYINDTTNGQFYPSHIDYTGNSAATTAPYNSVQFVYASRPDVTPHYQAGSLQRATVRLSDVKTYSGSTLVGDYKLAYQQSASTGRSEVANITLCAGDGSCLPPTSFGMTPGGDGSFAGADRIVPNGWNFGSPPSSHYTPITGDFNGDGKTDFLLLYGTTQFVFMSQGDGSFIATDGPNVWDFGTPPSSLYMPITGDFNGDGKTDFLLLSGTSQFVFISNGDGSFTATQRAQPNGWYFGSPVSSAYTPITGDFNGDGKTDFLLLSGTTQFVFISNGDGSFTAADRLEPNGWNFGSPVSALYTSITGDFNGDGKTDFVLLYRTSQFVFISNGDGLFTVTQQTEPNGWDFGGPVSSLYTPITGDFNGDGKTDFVLLYRTSQFVFISNGDGSFTVTQQTEPNGWDFGGPVSSLYTPITGDFNGDGKTDFVLLYRTSQFVFISNGDGSFTVTQRTEPNGWDFGGPVSSVYMPITGDFNGDGKTDFVLLAGTTQYSFLTPSAPADLVSTVTTGLGAASTLTYAPLTAGGAVYSKDKTAVYPQMDLQAALYTVGRVDASNGVGGTYSSTYSYAGAKVDLSGRGFLGFRQTTVKDLQTNIINMTSYRQDFPYLGLTSSSTRTLGSGVLGRTTNTYSSANAGAPYRVVLSQSVTEGSDLDGSVLPMVISSYSYDPFNNATVSIASTSDGFGTTAINTYSNDTANWFLGRLTRTSVTKTSSQPFQFCGLPWGGAVPYGQSVTAYSAVNPPAGQACSTIAQTRTCSAGTLSGSATQQSCAALCALPWGGLIRPGQTVTAYSAAAVLSPQVCGSVAQTRTCGADGVLSGSFTNGSCGVQVHPPKTLYLTSGSTWTVPSDWNNAANKIEVIGGGGGGNGGGGAGNGGGGGGSGYSSITNLTLTPGSTVSYSVGLGGTGQGVPHEVVNPSPIGPSVFIELSSVTAGGNTWFNGSSVSAQGGGAGAQVGGSGGQATNGNGTNRYSGGNGGDGYYGGGGGGGAAGPHGSGAAGGTFARGGGGGGGADGGGPGGNGSGAASGFGGYGWQGYGAWAGNCVSGTANTGAGGSGGNGGSNGYGVDIYGCGGGGSMDTAFDAGHGSGGGGGGGGTEWGSKTNNALNDRGYPGGAGASFGGGGGGGGAADASGGAGGDGIIVITYTPALGS
jgi:hypothetical protein